VDEPWIEPGRYGWVGGSGTAAFVVPARGAVSVVLTQVALTGPVSTRLTEDVWRYATG
jgi:CubicO group peptidase (beta-lactamase class C family)